MTAQCSFNSSLCFVKFIICSSMLQLLSIVPARFYLPASVAFFKNKRGYLEPVDLLGNGGG